MPLPLRSDKSDILGRRDGRNNRYLSCLQQKKFCGLRCSRPRKMEAAVLSSTTSEMGVFHGGFASSSNQLFASASYDGVLRVCFSLSLDTIHFGVLGVLFSHHHGSGDFPIITIRSLHTVHERKRTWTYRTTWGGLAGCGFLFGLLRPWCSRSSWGLHWANISVRGGLAKTLCGFCGWGISVSWYFRFGSAEGGWLRSWLTFPFFLALFFSRVYPFGFAVSWVDGGRLRLASTLISFYFPVWISRDCISDTVYGGRETFAFLA